MLTTKRANQNKHLEKNSVSSTKIQNKDTEERNRQTETTRQSDSKFTSLQVVNKQETRGDLNLQRKKNKKSEQVIYLFQHTHISNIIKVNQCTQNDQSQKLSEWKTFDLKYKKRVLAQD